MNTDSGVLVPSDTKRHESFPDPLHVTLTHVPDVFLNLTKIPLCIKLTRIRQSFPKPNHLVFMPKRHKIPRLVPEVTKVTRNLRVTGRMGREAVRGRIMTSGGDSKVGRG